MNAAADVWPGKRVPASAIDAHSSQKNVRSASYRFAGRLHTVGGRLPFIQLLNFKKMFYSIFLAIFLALTAPARKPVVTTTHHVIMVAAQDSISGSGGDNGHIPPQ